MHMTGGACGDEPQDCLTGVLGISDQGAVPMGPYPAPGRSRWIIKAGILNELHGLTIRISHHAQVIDEHLASSQEPHDELSPVPIRTDDRRLDEGAIADLLPAHTIGLLTGSPRGG